MFVYVQFYVLFKLFSFLVQCAKWAYWGQSKNNNWEVMKQTHQTTSELNEEHKNHHESDEVIRSTEQSTITTKSTNEINSNFSSYFDLFYNFAKKTIKMESTKKSKLIPSDLPFCTNCSKWQRIQNKLPCSFVTRNLKVPDEWKSNATKMIYLYFVQNITDRFETFLIKVWNVLETD